MGNTKVAMKKPHAIMISVPYQGHLNPFVQLAIKLASKGFAVTFVHTEYVHHLITKSHHHNIIISENASSDDPVPVFDIFSEAREFAGLDIRYATITDGFPLEYDRNANISVFWDYLLHKFSSHVDDFISNLIESMDSTLVPFLVADTFAPWPGLVAKKYNLVHVSFWTQPAAVFSINYHIDMLSEKGYFPYAGAQDSLITCIPGVEPISTKDLMSHLQDQDTTTVVHKIVFKSFEEVKNADFILHNTVQELESNTLSILNQLNPTYAIGPINFIDTKINVSKSLLSETDCTEWLNSKPPGSVLYVSFGSLVLINKQVIEEVAKGLRLSQVNFLWSIRPDSVEDETTVLPRGFEDEVKDRGLVVPWCNQNAVLSHPAVGGFVTHCGWNSILESVWFGVPMICYPVLYDQPTNRKLVMDDWKIGVNLFDGAGVNGEDLALKIRTAMSGETSSDRVRNQMKKFQRMLRGALGEEGSSERNFDRFVKDLVDKIMH